MSVMSHEFEVALYPNRNIPVVVADPEAVCHGDLIIVETEDGLEAGKISRIPKVLQPVLEKTATPPPTASFVRVATPEDKQSLAEKKVQELQAFQKCKAMIEKLGLSMRLVTAYYTFDRSKITFYFTSPQRVDFRGLLKELIQVIRRVRINLRHIGTRDEAALFGGIGPCGRELCCSSWHREFKPVNIALAKTQSLTINPQKILGNCGRLMCCLNFEHETYVEAAGKMPVLGTGVQTPDGRGRAIGLNFLKEEITVKLENGTIDIYKASGLAILPDDEMVHVTIELQPLLKEEPIPDDLTSLVD